MSEIVLTLPDSLVEEARENGLLAPAFMTSMLKEELRRRKVNRLFAAADSLAEFGDPMSDEEVMAEVRAVRAERRQRR